ncbi:MAG: signal peptide peptidase SppA [Rickettsiales bacterium]
MPFTPDQIMDRKRLKAQLGRWRFIAILAGFGALFALANPEGMGAAVGKPYIARITIDGVMTDDEKRDALIDKVKNDVHAKAVIVRFDTPGGTALAGEEVYLQLRELAKKKPVIAVMRTVCASAGYMAALGTDYMIARESTITGSIGVMMQSLEVSRLADKLGITPITIKSGEFKDSPSLTKPFSERERAVVSETVDDAYAFFVGLVAERRDLNLMTARRLGDGRVYTGRQAYALKLIDGLGGDAEAIAWMAKNRQIPATLKVVDSEPEPEFQTILEKLQQLTNVKIFSSLTVPLDGLVSLWHPSSQF